MTVKEMRKLSRTNLLELLLEERRLNDEQAAEIETLKAALADKDLEIEQSGTMAEAAMKLSGIFSSADAAAAQYKQNAEARSRVIIAEAKSKAAQIIAEAEAKASSMLNEIHS